jgi:hypothetical protein
MLTKPYASSLMMRDEAANIVSMFKIEYMLSKDKYE